MNLPHITSKFQAVAMFVTVNIKKVCRYVYDPYPYKMSHASSTGLLVIVIKLEGKYRFFMTVLHSTLPPSHTNQRKRTTMKVAYFSKTCYQTKI